MTETRRAVSLSCDTIGADAVFFFFFFLLVVVVCLAAIVAR